MKTKVKVLALLCALLMLVTLVLTSCAKSSNDDSDSGDAFVPTPSPEVTPPSASDSGNLTPGLGNGSGNEQGSTSPDDTDWLLYAYAPYSELAARNVTVGYEAEYLATNLARKLPEVKDGALSSGYPKYGYTLALTDEQKQAIQLENASMLVSATTFNALDANGNLLLNGEPVLDENGEPLKLYKHTASEGMYFGNVLDSEPAISKRITIAPRAVGNYVTGVYAPAGEVLKVEISQEVLDATGGLVFDIGQCSFTGQANNIWNARDFNRMPWITTSFVVTDTTAYIGFALGGPVYVRPVRSNATFSFTISGGVKYPHYIHGYTTSEEYAFNLNGSAPYFDLEVVENGVRHSGSRQYGSDLFDYEQLTAAAVLWEKIATVSNQVPTGSKSTIGINFLYDPFIAAGAAVAFVGNNWVNCPPSWMSGSLNVDAFTESGAWGNVHEYNHHYQNYGLPNGGEVTNNATSLVSYTLFTNISANRQLGVAVGGKWNNYVDPGWVMDSTNAIRATLEGGNGNYALEAYANILHSFGQDNFLRAAKAGGGKKTVDGYYTALTEIIGYDFSYYFKEVLNLTPSDSVLELSKGLPLYIPAASTLQTGASFVKDGVTYVTNTARPYRIATNADFTFDLNTAIKVPTGVEFNIKEITAPRRGTLLRVDDGVYTYTPNGDNDLSGEIYVTLELYAPGYGSVELTLVMQFEPDANYKPNVLSTTTYVYDVDTMPDIDQAISNDYRDAVRAEQGVIDMSLGGMNGNAQVWFPEQGTITEYRGRLLFTDTGRYRVALRGRYYAYLYLSYDGGASWNKVVSIYNENLPSNFNNDKYVDVEATAGQFLDFKVVLYNKNNAVNTVYASLGWGKYDASGNVSVNNVTNAYKEGYMPTPTKVFDNPYARTYKDNYVVVANNSKMEIVGDSYECAQGYELGRGLDGDRTTAVIAVNNNTFATPTNPFYFTVKTNQAFEANRITLYAYKHSNGKTYLPGTIRVYVGTSETDLKFVGEKTFEGTVTNDSAIYVEFEKQVVNYYKVEIVDMLPDHRYATFSEVELSYTLDGEAEFKSATSDMVHYTGNWTTAGKLSPFGQIVIGESGSRATFTFSGTRFWLYSYFATGYGTFDVYVDGNKVGTVNLSSGDNLTKYSFVYDTSLNGPHTVELVGVGAFNIAAIATM